MALSGNVADSPGRIATALGADLTDNTNAQRLASIGEMEISDLDSLTAGQFYRQLVSDIGQQLSIKQMSQSSTENLVQSLTNQQSEISGVDINDEAAQMLVFEQMFQAMAKYLSTVQFHAGKPYGYIVIADLRGDDNMSGILNNVYNNISFALARQTEALSRLQEQASTGSRINRPSDDPSTAYQYSHA